MSIFDRTTTGRHVGCWVCGAKTEVTVLVQITESKPGGGSGRRVSKSRSYCAIHGELMFKQLLQTPNFDREL